MESLIVAAWQAFVTEFGDRSQLLTILLSIRLQRARLVLAAGVSGYAIVQAFHRFASEPLVEIFDSNAAAVIAGALFVLLSAIMLANDAVERRLDARSGGIGVFAYVMLVFVLAGVGDRTQDVADEVARQHAMPFSAALGAAIGLLFADTPAAMLGYWFRLGVSARAANYAPSRDKPETAEEEYLDFKPKIRGLMFPRHVRTALRSWLRVRFFSRFPRPPAGTADVSAYEVSVLSQHGEDGILREIFTRVGFTNRKFVEFGFHPGEANALTLAMRDGFSGTFLDANPRMVMQAERGFALLGLKCRAVTAMVTPDGVEALFAELGIAGELDLLSIDIDSVDYWVMRALNNTRARVLVMEFNAAFGPDARITVPADFVARGAAIPAELKPTYWGASLGAIVSVAQSKGYRFVGIDSTLTNAFFLRDELGTADFAQQDIAAMFARRIGRLGDWRSADIAAAIVAGDLTDTA